MTSKQVFFYLFLQTSFPSNIHLVTSLGSEYALKYFLHNILFRVCTNDKLGINDFTKTKSLERII